MIKPLNEDIDTGTMTGGEPRKFVKGERRLMKVFISPRLQDILGKITKTGTFQSKAVANRILGLKNTDELFDISYLDIDKEKDDSITFMPVNRAWLKMAFPDQETADKEPSPACEMWTAAGRQPLSVGKLVNRLFDDFKDESIAKFVDSYKAEVAAIMIYNRFKEVKGEDIRFWYAESNYASPGTPGLANSCMRYDGTTNGTNCQPFFDIYCKNPEKCSLLILTDHRNKLIGRAVVWHDLRKPTAKTFMDRIYVTKQSDAELFKKYAQEQGWLYKYDQQAQDASYMEDGKRVQKSIAIALKPVDHKKYPYMDTLKFYNPSTGRLGSDAGNPVDGTKRYKCESGTGQPSQILDP